jgi:hypothetical protein
MSVRPPPAAGAGAGAGAGAAVGAAVAVDEAAEEAPWRAANLSAGRAYATAGARAKRVLRSMVLVN